MRRACSWILATAFLLASTTIPSVALAGSTKVEWKKVEAPSGVDHDRVVQMLKPILRSTAKKADFGKTKKLVLTARVLEFRSVTRGDVHRVSCTLVGRIVGGPTARSHISFGGHLNERAALEKQVLTMVATGVVTRLSEIVRNRAAAEAKAKDD
jgi:hypothetical protein